MTFALGENSRYLTIQTVDGKQTFVASPLKMAQGLAIALAVI